MNPVLTLCRNNLQLTKRFAGSVLAQDISTRLFFVDNGSSDGTKEWLSAFDGLAFSQNKGVSYGWNVGLSTLFNQGADHVLVCGNDTILASWTYSLLLAYNLGFVTGVAVDDLSQVRQKRPPLLPLEKHPDFSCYLVRRAVWERVGRFDDRMKHYASDTDYHVRAHRLGVDLYKACCPFYHERSSTLRNASPEERAEIQEQANKDRAVFQSIYHCLPGQPEYEALFADKPLAHFGNLQ